MTELNKYQTKFLDALRNGTYPQGKGALRTRRNTWCCLGVGADVCGVTWSEEPTHLQSFTTCYSYGWFPHTGFLGRREARRLKLPKKIQYVLAIANDEGVSFKAVADGLEWYWDTDPTPEPRQLRNKLIRPAPI